MKLKSNILLPLSKLPIINQVDLVWTVRVICHKKDDFSRFHGNFFFSVCSCFDIVFSKSRTLYKTTLKIAANRQNIFGPFHDKNYFNNSCCNGILLPKLFGSTVRKIFSSDWETLLKFKAVGREFAKILRSVEQFIQTVKGQNNFW